MSELLASQLVSLVQHRHHQLLEVGLVLAVARGGRGGGGRGDSGELRGGSLRHAVLRDGRHHVAHHVPHDGRTDRVRPTDCNERGRSQPLILRHCTAGQTGTLTETAFPGNTPGNTALNSGMNERWRGEQRAVVDGRRRY